MIRRYKAIADTSIVNAVEDNLSTRTTEMNTGASDVLETFVVYAQASTSSSEHSRILVKFPVDDIYADIFSGSLPDSGVSYFLRMFNVKHGETLPFDFDLEVVPLSQSWNEGHGLTMAYEGAYFTGSGASWTYRENSSSLAWVTPGGDTSGSALTTHFDIGDEDLELDISGWVNQWITYEASGSDQPNYGLMIKFPDSQESGSLSLFTKRFSARTSEYFFSRPIIEARYNDAVTDDRGNFFASSSLTTDNQNSLYFYNRPKGSFTNIPSTPVTVKFFDTQSGTGSVLPDEADGGGAITASLVSTGKYKITCSLNTTEEVVWDRWYNGAGVCFMTGSVDILSAAASQNDTIPEYVLSIPKLKQNYKTAETSAKIELFIREKDWSPTIYTVATATVENKILEDVYYQLRRVVDDSIVFDYNTGDDENATLLSYDSGGNYFIFDMSLLEPNYMYEFMFAIKVGGVLRIQEEVFRFRVQE